MTSAHYCTATRPEPAPLEKCSTRLALQSADLNSGRLFHRAMILTARPGCSGGGGLCSTAEDYYRFCQMMLNKGELNGVRLLSRKSVELMTQEKLSPLPWGESGPLPAFSSAGAGRVRGYLDGAAQIFAAVRSAVILWRCEFPPNACANCGAPKLILKKRRGICCATESWGRNFAANAASKTGLWISTASNIDWRSSLMAVCTRSPAKCGKTLRKRII